MAKAARARSLSQKGAVVSRDASPMPVSLIAWNQPVRFFVKGGDVKFSDTVGRVQAIQRLAVPEIRSMATCV